MRCISPIYLKTSSGERHYVSCGKCNFCLQSRRDEWTFRLEQQLKVSNNANFITLTYEDNNLPMHGYIPVLCKTDVQNFFKRLRKHQETYERKHNLDKWIIKYFACGEYGTKTNRPHYHVIAFNIRLSSLHRIQEIWGLGEQVRVEPCTLASIAYTTKYVINKTDYGTYPVKPFSLISKGIGECYLENNLITHQRTKRFHSKSGGITRKLPRYYVDKIFTKHDKYLHAAKTDKEMFLIHLKQIEDLKKLHPDPELYILQKLQQQHDKIRSKINNSNTF